MMTEDSYCVESAAAAALLSRDVVVVNQQYIEPYETLSLFSLSLS